MLLLWVLAEAHGDPNSTMRSAAQAWEWNASLSQSCMVASSKYMEKSIMRILLTNAWANLDHLLKDVTALGSPKRSPWYS